MGASGPVSLREASALGFGRYDFNSVTTSGQSIPGWFSYSQGIPQGAGGGGRTYQLIGSLYVPDCPPDMVSYFVTTNQGPTLQAALDKQRVMSANPEPLYIFLGRELQNLDLALTYRGWAFTFLGGSAPTVNFDTLTGSLEQLEALIKFLSDRQAPQSLITDAIDLLAGSARDIVQAATPGDYY